MNRWMTMRSGRQSYRPPPLRQRITPRSATFSSSLLTDEAAADSARYLSTQSETVSELIRRVTGRKVRVRIDAPARRSINSIRASRTLIKEATQLPVVRKAMEIFDAVVIDVEDAPAEAQPRETQTEDSTDV